MFQEPAFVMRPSPPRRRDINPFDPNVFTIGRPSEEKTTINTTISNLRDAGVGNLSLGGADKRYRLRDFEVFPRNPDTTPQILSTLVKNKQNRRRKK